MCTLAWGTQGDSLWACFNRDEQHVRAPAEEPGLHDSTAGPVVYARDPEGGGTWFAASARGFAVALLNNYPRGGGTIMGGKRSRGLLVKDLADCAAAIEVYDRMGQEPLALYSPFHLFVLTHRSSVGLTWDGWQLSFIDPDLRFFTTSSRRSAEVCEWRRQFWEKHAAGGMDLAKAGALMRDGSSRDRHLPDSSFALTMDRDDARTCSQIKLEMKQDCFVFSYRARETCGTGFERPQIVRYP